MPKTKEQNNRNAKVYYWKRKSEAIDVLGGKCERCGISDKRVLRIVGKKRMNVSLFKDIIKGKTDDNRVLCANCYIIETKKFPLALDNRRRALVED